MWLVIPAVVWFVTMLAIVICDITDPGRRVLPKPDYARIAWLEHELGLDK